MARIAFAWLVLALALAGVGPARADVLRGSDGNPVLGADGYPVVLTKLETSCGTSLDRFCPNWLSLPGQTRNEAICLKPYRANLTPGCRAAVSAASK